MENLTTKYICIFGIYYLRGECKHIQSNLFGKLLLRSVCDENLDDPMEKFFVQFVSEFKIKW